MQNLHQIFWILFYTEIQVSVLTIYLIVKTKQNILTLH